MEVSGQIHTPPPALSLFLRESFSRKHFGRMLCGPHLCGLRTTSFCITIYTELRWYTQSKYFERRVPH
jgi:hypothetical protein